MNIAIIGCGYVGKEIARYWRQDKGFAVTATTTTPERVASLSDVAQQVVVAKGNDEEALRSIVENQDTILLSVGARGAEVYEETYLHTAKTLVNVLQQTPSVQQLIYTGSYSVYGDRQGEWVNEDSPVAPANRNGEILYQTEEILLSAASENLRVCILRLGGIYGPERTLVKIFSRAFGTTRPGDGSEVTNWVHLDDIVAAIEFARSKQLQGIYNLVNSAPIAGRELLGHLCDRHNLPKVLWEPNLPQVRPYNARVSNQKIKAAGYSFIHDTTIE